MAELNEIAFAAWAPDASPWSVWAKPVLFADAVTFGGGGASRPSRDEVARFPGPGATALVIDLPGAAGVELGLALAERGYRPVPLYNASRGTGALVDVVPIASALAAGAGELALLRLPDDAPPAFLLDSERMKGSPQPGRFDNRWLVFPQDFPSAAFLASRGIRRVLVVQHDAEPRDDLAHVLLRWQRAGIELSVAAPAAADAARPLVVKPPSRFRRAWYRALAVMGLRRSNVGGFGAPVPMPSASSG